MRFASLSSVPVAGFQVRRSAPFAVVSTSAAACLLLCGVAFLLAVIAWRSSPGLWPDSVTYLDAAQSIREGRGLTHRWAYWDPVYETCKLPTPTTLWPPGYPLAIAGVSLLGLDLYTAARLVAAFCFVLLPVPIFLLLRTAMPDRPATLFAAASTFLLPVFTTATEVASEMPFLLLASASLYFSTRALAEKGDSSRLWMLAGATAGLSAVFRYVGFACALAVIVLAAFQLRREGWRKGLRALLCAALPSSALIGAILARNWLATGMLTDCWPGAGIFWSSAIDQARAITGATLGPVELLDSAFSALLRPAQLLLWVALVGMTVVAIFRISRRPDFVVHVSAVVFTAVALYWVLVLGARWMKGMDVEPRYGTVILPWLLAAAFVLAYDCRRQFAAHAAHTVGALFLACHLTLIGLQAHSPDGGYVWETRNDPIFDWLRKQASPNEIILTTRGADVAQWCPNPVLRLPRRPYSGVKATDWSAVRHTADRWKARYLVHWIGFPASGRYDKTDFEFVRILDDPAQVPFEVAARSPAAIVYKMPNPADFVTAGVQP